MLVQGRRRVGRQEWIETAGIEGKRDVLGPGEGTPLPRRRRNGEQPPASRSESQPYESCLRARWAFHGSDVSGSHNSCKKPARRIDVGRAFRKSVSGESARSGDPRFVAAQNWDQPVRQRAEPNSLPPKLRLAHRSRRPRNIQVRDKQAAQQPRARERRTQLQPKTAEPRLSRPPEASSLPLPFSLSSSSLRTDRRQDGCQSKAIEKMGERF